MDLHREGTKFEQPQPYTLVGAVAGFLAGYATRVSRPDVDT
jgi:hypothetical protein